MPTCFCSPQPDIFIDDTLNNEQSSSPVPIQERTVPFQEHTLPGDTDQKEVVANKGIAKKHFVDRVGDVRYHHIVFVKNGAMITRTLDKWTTQDASVFIMRPKKDGDDANEEDSGAEVNYDSDDMNFEVSPSSNIKMDISDEDIESLLDVIILSPPLVTKLSFQEVHHRIAPILGRKLGEKKSLKELDLGRRDEKRYGYEQGSTPLFGKDIEMVCEVLKNTSSLETLTFFGRLVNPDHSIDLLSEAFHSNSTLRTLEFGAKSSIPDECMAKLLLGLVGHTALESIVFLTVLNYSKAVEALAAIVMSPESRLEKLTFMKWGTNGAGAGDQTWDRRIPDHDPEDSEGMDVSPLVEALANGHQFMRELDISQKTVSEEAFTRLAAALETNTIALQHLVLYQANVTTDGMKKLSSALKSNTSLTFLDLSGIPLDDDTMKILAESLAKNSTLKSLHMESCSITSEGIESFALGMRSMTTLEELEIGFNPFDERGVNALNEALRYNSSVSTMHFPSHAIFGVVGMMHYSCNYGNPASHLLDLNVVSKVDLSAASKHQLENVAGYLECQRRLGSITAKKDPNGELSSIDFQVDGISFEQDGKIVYDGGKRQQNVNGGIVQSLEELMEAAASAKQVYDTLLSTIWSHIDGPDPEKRVKTCPLKKGDRIVEKALNDYFRRRPGPGIAWVNDVCRGTLLCQTSEQMLAINEYLQAKRTTGEVEIISAKNRFKNPTLSGYRDWLLVLRLRVEGPDGQVFHFNCELQIHLEEIWSENKALHSHKYYEFFRENFAGNDSAAVSELISLLGPIHETGQVDASFIKSTIESENVEKMTKLSNLFRNFLPEPNVALNLRRKVLEVERSRHGDSYGSAETYEIVGDLWALLHDQVEDCMEHRRNAYNSSLKIYESDKEDNALELLSLKAKIVKLAPDLEEAKSYLELLESMVEKEGSETIDLRVLRARLLSIMGDSHRKDENTEEAIRCHQEAMSIQRTIFDEFHPTIAQCWCDLGHDHRIAEGHDEALECFEKSLEAFRRGLGEMHSETAKAHEQLGRALDSTNNIPRALVHLKKSVEILKAVGADPLRQIARVLNFIGRLHSQIDELSSSKAIFLEELAIRESLSENYDSDLLACLRWLNSVMLKISMREGNDSEL